MVKSANIGIFCCFRCQTFSCSIQHIWWLVRVIKVISFGFLSHNFRPVVRTCEYHLPFCENSWSVGSIWRWWGYLNTTCCNQKYLNFLYSVVVRTHKPSLDCLCYLCALPLHLSCYHALLSCSALCMLDLHPSCPTFAPFTSCLTS